MTIAHDDAPLQHVKVSIEGSIGELVLARPDVRNAMTEEMGEEVSRAVERLNAASDVRAVLVRGEGKAFCAGGNLGFLEARIADSAESNRAAMRRFYALFLSVQRLRAPSIALIQGPAMGAGLCFALACDLRLASTTAQMGLNFVRLSLHPGMGATYLLPRLVGPSVAADLLLTGRSVDGAEAQRLGLVSEACEPDALLARGRALAEQIAQAGPLAVEACKRSLSFSPHRTLDEALDAEAAAQAVDYATDDLREGVASARERRAPKFERRLAIGTPSEGGYKPPHGQSPPAAHRPRIAARSRPVRGLLVAANANRSGSLPGLLVAARGGESQRAHRRAAHGRRGARLLHARGRRPAEALHRAREDWLRQRDVHHR